MGIIRDLNALLTLGRGRVQFNGSFAPNDTSAVSASSRQGQGWSVARTSAGLFTVTFNSGYKFQAYENAWAHLQLATGDDKFAQVGSVSVANRTMTIRVWDISGAAETDVAPDANNIISFGITFRNTPTGASPARG